jgi:hypothetical protein
MAVTYKPLMLPRKYFVSNGVFTPADFDRFIAENNIPTAEEGYDVLSILRTCNFHRRTYKKELNMQKQMAGGENFSAELEFEKVLSQRITNQQKLGILMEKKDAKSRMLKALRLISQKIGYSIKMASRELPGILDVKVIETILSRHYNSVILMLKDDSQLISWEEDGSSELLRTRVMEQTEEISARKTIAEVDDDLDVEALREDLDSIVDEEFTDSNEES